MLIWVCKAPATSEVAERCIPSTTIVFGMIATNRIQEGAHSVASISLRLVAHDHLIPW